MVQRPIASVQRKSLDLLQVNVRRQALDLRHRYKATYPIGKRRNRRTQGVDTNKNFKPNKRMRQIARLGAYALHSKYDGRYLTANARAAFLARFEDQVDPDRQLSPDERSKRAVMARKAYFLRLAMKSATARRRKTADEGD